MSKNIVFIPIKQISERVPNKNFRSFQGKTLWEHTIDKLKSFKVYIDTDSSSIIEKCKSKPWVTTYKRNSNLLGNRVSVVDILDNFITKYNITTPICQIHVTSPLLQVEHINHSFSLINKDFDSVFGVTKTQKRFWGENGLPLNHNPKKLLPTQDLQVWYEENSYLYTFKPKVITECGNRIGGHFHMMEIGFPYNLDIDTEDDWNLINKLI
tara:strand:+ start:7235 stop:7867 length:633 start_codon:yes stop_codon:yes gene_type:complete